MIPYLWDRNFLTENEVLSKFFSWECALIRIQELKRLQQIENKFNSIWNIIAMKDSNITATGTFKL